MCIIIIYQVIIFGISPENYFITIHLDAVVIGIVQVLAPELKDAGRLRKLEVFFGPFLYHTSWSLTIFYYYHHHNFYAFVSNCKSIEDRIIIM